MSGGVAKPPSPLRPSSRSLPRSAAYIVIHESQISALRRACQSLAHHLLHLVPRRTAVADAESGHITVDPDRHASAGEGCFRAIRFALAVPSIRPMTALLGFAPRAASRSRLGRRRRTKTPHTLREGCATTSAYRAVARDSGCSTPSGDCLRLAGAPPGSGATGAFAAPGVQAGCARCWL